MTSGTYFALGEVALSFEPIERMMNCDGEPADINKLISDVSSLKESIESIKSALYLNHLSITSSEKAQLSEKISKSPVLLSRAKREIWEIRERRRICADLAKSSSTWDMMLELYVAALQGRGLRTKNLLLATITPETTALRWIMFLEERGYIVRTPCPSDKRVIWITMTEVAMSCITDLLEVKYDRA